MTFILPSFGASAIAAVPGGGGGFSNDYSVDFDGTDEYLATTYQYGSATQFTYSFWIKTTDTGNSHWVGNSFTGGYDSRCHFGTKGGLYYFLLGNSSNYYQVQQGSASAVTDGNWHHMVFQWDGTNTNGVKLYVDGNTTPVFTYTSTVASNASAAPLMWGIGWGSSFYAYDGLMDEAALFESILSTSQITNIYRGEDDGGSGGTNGVPGDLDTFNPVGWWRMGDSDSGVSNGSSTPTIVSNVGNSSAIKDHYSLSYDGSDDNAKVTGLSLSGATSFSLWWNGQEATTNTTFPLLHQDSSNIFVDIGASMFRVYLYDGTNGGYIYRQHSFASPTQGQWYHFGITYDGTTNGSGLKTYIDGSLTGSGAVSGTFNSFNTQGSKPLGIGARLTYAHSGVYASQLIDEVAIFNSELSATNISDIYNSGVPTDIGTNGLNLSPIAWWRMEEGSGTSVVNTANSGTYDLGLFNTDGSGPTFSTNVPT